MEWKLLKDIPANCILFGIAVLLIKHFLKENEENSKYYRKKITEISESYEKKLSEITMDAKIEREKSLERNKNSEDNFIKSLKSLIEKDDKIVAKIEQIEMKVDDIEKKADKTYDLVALNMRKGGGNV